MKARLAIITVVLALTAAAHAAAQASGAPAIPPNMKTYQLVMLKYGPAVSKINTEEGQKTISDHVAFLYKQGAAGAYVAAGPFTDGGVIQGIMFVAAPTPEAALKIEAQDPAVKSGIFAAEAIPFLSAAQFSGKWAEAGKFEEVYFGFLNNGSDRTQDEATAKLLQARHIGYMDGQEKLGKLIVAGPFMAPDGERRGLVVYRVATPEEAQERANGDPMVKAGRLSVELHPWKVPIGALPKK